MRFGGLIGIVVLLGIAFALSTDRRRVPWRVVCVGMGLQLGLAALLMGVPQAVALFDTVARGFATLISFSTAGAEFLFGSGLTDPAAGAWGFVFAFQVLPVIIFFAALMGVLYHVRVMQLLITGLAWCLRRSMGVTGVEAMAAAANVFVGQTEAPLCVKPYLEKMSESQLMVIMTTGFATIAGSVLAGYVSVLGGDDPAKQVLFAKHLLMASVMSAPGAFVMAKVFVPVSGDEVDADLLSIDSGERAANVLDAASRGASDGLRLAVNVAAMLVAFVALLAMLDWPLQKLGEVNAIDAWLDARGVDTLSMQVVLGVLFRPVAWLMSLAGDDAAHVGGLLGTSVVATEFVAYLKLGELLRQGAISARGAEVVTFALCGFANLPSVAIQIGGLSALAPSRRAVFARIGLRAMLAGLMACWMTACVASLFIPAGGTLAARDVNAGPRSAEQSSTEQASVEQGEDGGAGDGEAGPGDASGADVLLLDEDREGQDHDRAEAQQGLGDADGQPVAGDE